MRERLVAILKARSVLAISFLAKAIRSGELVQQFRVRPALQHRRQLPGEVHGIAHAGVHALAAGRAMDVAGITGDEDPAERGSGRRRGGGPDRPRTS